MSGQGTAPVARPLAQASTARDVERLQAHADATRYDWKVDYDGEVSVAVMLFASAQGSPLDQKDSYLVVLDCDSYDTWPPEVKFVNPATRRYVVGEDERFLPRIEGFPNFGLHPRYQGFLNNPARVDQLVCFSLTRGYYDTSHTPEPHQRWTPGRHWLYSTVKVLHRALQPPYYRGRFA